MNNDSERGLCGSAERGQNTMEAWDITTGSDHVLQLDATSREVVARSGARLQSSDRGVGNRGCSRDPLERELETVVGDWNGKV